MINWRNKPIDVLSEAELRHALHDAVQQMMRHDKTAVPHQTAAGFIIGLGCGAALMMVAFATGFLVG